LARIRVKSHHNSKIAAPSDEIHIPGLHSILDQARISGRKEVFPVGTVGRYPWTQDNDTDDVFDGDPNSIMTSQDDDEVYVFGAEVALSLISSIAGFFSRQRRVMMSTYSRSFWFSSRVSCRVRSNWGTQDTEG
jgi:hypothetical protein